MTDSTTPSPAEPDAENLPNGCCHPPSNHGAHVTHSAAHIARDDASRG